MREKILFLVMLLVIMAASVSAELTDQFISDIDTNQTLTQNTDNLLNNASVLNETWLEFDGVDDWIDLGTGDEFDKDLNDSFTVSAWIFLNDKDFDHNIVGRFDTSGNQRSWVVSYSASGKNLRFTTNPLGTTGNDSDQFGTTILNLSRWYHTVFVYNGTHKIIYLNGVNDSTEAYALGIFDTTGEKAFIGTIDDSTHTNIFNGSIDDILIYNISLSNAEIIGLNNSGRNCNRTIANDSLISAFCMNENSGNITYDSFNNTINGTISGNPLWNNSGVRTALNSTTDFSLSGSAFDLLNNFYNRYEVQVDFNCINPLTNAINFTQNICTNLQPFNYSDAINAIKVHNRNATAFQLNFSGLPAINQIFNGTSATPTSENLSIFNESVPAGNRTLVFSYDTAAQPTYTSIATTITNTNFTYDSSAKRLDLDCEGSGNIAIANLDTIKGSRDTYVVYYNGVFQGYFSSNDYTISSCSSWVFLTTENARSNLSSTESFLIFLACFLIVFGGINLLLSETNPWSWVMILIGATIAVAIVRTIL